MAQKIITQLVDDTTGEDIADGEGETVSFALDGQSYTIDLTSKNANAFRGLFMDYVAVASKAGRKAGAQRGSNGRASSGPSAKEVRVWARSNGHDVPDRGRIPAEVREAFDAAN